MLLMNFTIKVFKLFLVIFIVLGVAILCLVKDANKYLSLRYNQSTSEPIGEYLILPWVLTKGNTYLVCLEKKFYIKVLQDIGLMDNNDCKSKNATLLKTIVGSPGDIVNVEEGGVLINGELLQNSIAIKNTKLGIGLHPILPKTKFILGKKDYWVHGITKNSYDSRYFGVVSENEIYGRAI